VSLDAISWLGAFYAKSEMYEKALTFFERAAQIQPHVLNWKLMVASCYRRMGSFDRALSLFEQLHLENPDNVDCLTYLVQACKEAGQSYDQYVTLLNKLIREKSMQAPAAPQQDSEPSYSSSAAPQAEMITSDIRGLRGGKQVAVVKQQDEDDWAKEANMDELLP
jgi:intraflagellar transport protein 88